MPSFNIFPARIAPWACAGALALGAVLLGAAVILELRRSIRPDFLTFKRTHFAPALAQSFVLAAETAHCPLWVRPDGGAIAGPKS